MLNNLLHTGLIIKEIVQEIPAFLKIITMGSVFYFTVFSCILFFRKTPIRKANLMLGITFFLMTVYSFSLYFYYEAIYTQSTYMLSMYFPLDLIIAMFMGPSIYFYVKILLNENYIVLQKKNILHLLSILLPVAFSVWLLSQPLQAKIELLSNNLSKTIWQIQLLNVLFFCSIFTYVFNSYKIVKKQINLSSYICFNKVLIDIRWLKKYFYLVFVLLFLSIPASFISGSDTANSIIGLLVMNVQFIFIFIQAVTTNSLSYYGEKRIPNTSTSILYKEETKTEEKTSYKTEKTNEETQIEPHLKLDEALANEYLNKLNDYFHKFKPYLKSDCNMQQISEKSRIPLHHLSYILNTKLKKNFSDYVNEFRIKEAQRLILDERYANLTFEAIGYECGFGSKSSFNKAFKKQTDQTPSEFKNSITTLSQ